MHIGILQCGRSPKVFRDNLGDFDSMFQNLLTGRDFLFSSWHVEGMEFPNSVHDADGWLLTGSRHGVYEDQPFIAPLEDFIRRSYDAAVPMVGICFGHQIIAQALGGTVIKSPHGWVVGTQDYDVEGGKIALNAWHQDQVVTLPPHARVIGSNPVCDYAMLAYQDRAMTIQAHPEFDDDVISALIEHRSKGIVPSDRIKQACDDMGTPLQSRVIADRIEQFFKSPRATER